MKPRRVIVEIELETAMSIADLKELYKCEYELFGGGTKVHQVTVNVIQKPKKAKAKK